jgi:hypothetical protein
VVQVELRVCDHGCGEDGSTVFIVHEIQKRAVYVELRLKNPRRAHHGIPGMTKSGTPKVSAAGL